MKTNDRRDFLKKSVLAGASLFAAPSFLSTASNKEGCLFPISGTDLGDTLIVPKNNGLKITGTFLDEISHDIPHQNWGMKEWDLDFQHMCCRCVDNSSHQAFSLRPRKRHLFIVEP